MWKSLILIFALFLAFISLPTSSWASKVKHIKRSKALDFSLSLQNDSLKRQQEIQEKNAKNDKKTEQVPNKKPEIATVPKARKQSRPKVVKPIVVAKPIKVIKPKIKKP